MKYISPSQLFKEQLSSIGEKKAKVVLDNFIHTEKMFKAAIQQVNISKMSMIIKVKNSAYSVKYTYDKTESYLLAEKLLLMR